jgi:hypothetical protein
MLANYSKVSRVRKSEPDGSKQILLQASAGNYSVERVRVVGVERSNCVYETICGLQRLRPETYIEVAVDATADPELYNYDRECLEQLKKTGVRLLRNESK